jgi:hypothetical protein
MCHRLSMPSAMPQLSRNLLLRSHCLLMMQLLQCHPLSHTVGQCVARGMLIRGTRVTPSYTIFDLRLCRVSEVGSRLQMRHFPVEHSEDQLRWHSKCCLQSSP